MKKNLFISLLMLLPMVAVADSVLDSGAIEIGGIAYNLDANAKVAEVTNGVAYTGSVVIPEKVDYNGVEYSVTSIGERAFELCYNLTSVNIGNGVTSIGERAFYACLSLLSITIPASVTSIGYQVFYDCRSLNSIKVETSNTKYDSREGCNAIIETGTNRLIAGCQNTTIPASVTSIGGAAFLNIQGLTSITIPNSVTSIGENAFSECTNLSSVTIGNSVTSIGDFAFWCCVGLTSITIPNSVTSIGMSAFAGCDLAEVISLIENPFDIDNSVFSDKTFGYGRLYVPIGTIDIYRAREGWKKFYIHTVEGLGPSGYDIVAKNENGLNLYYKFINNESELEIINIPNNTHYYNGDLVIPEFVTYKNKKYNVTSIDTLAFSKSDILTVKIPNSMKTIELSAFENCGSLTSVTIPEGVVNIEYAAFRECGSLTSFTIPNSVTSIECDAFKNTGWYKNQSDGLLYLDNWLICYKGKLTGDCSIAEGTKRIADLAFLQCGLTSVTIPGSVTSIGENVFSWCTSLKAINVDGSNASYISEDGVLFNTDKSTLIHYPSAKSGSTYVVPASVTSISKFAFSRNSSLTSLTIPNSVTSLGYGAFNSCSVLTSVTIGNSVTSIGREAFYGCSSLTDVYCLAENVPDTNADAFSNTQIGEAILHVPAASVDAYKATSPWSGFKEVVALTDQETGIEGFANDSKTEVARYTIGGQRVNKQRKGLNIIRMSDGTTKKVVVK